MSRARQTLMRTTITFLPKMHLSDHAIVSSHRSSPRRRRSSMHEEALASILNPTWLLPRAVRTCDSAFVARDQLQSSTPPPCGRGSLAQREQLIITNKDAAGDCMKPAGFTNNKPCEVLRTGSSVFATRPAKTPCFFIVFSFYVLLSTDSRRVGLTNSGLLYGALTFVLSQGLSPKIKGLPHRAIGAAVSAVDMWVMGTGGHVTKLAIGGFGNLAPLVGKRSSHRQLLTAKFYAGDRGRDDVCSFGRSDPKGPFHEKGAPPYLRRGAKKSHKRGFPTISSNGCNGHSLPATHEYRSRNYGVLSLGVLCTYPYIVFPS
jgi:hypothetical protein